MNRLRLGVGLLAASTAIVSLATPLQHATADPLLSKAVVGVGSDTTQDIHNAFAGAAPFTVPAGQGGTRSYNPLFSSPGSGNVPTASWDAQDPLGSTCIIPKLGAGQVDRPNGSTDGVKALSKATQGTRWDAGKGCSPLSVTNNVQGTIDFARSSSGANATKFPGTTLTFIPFARDGLGYAYVDKDNSGTFTGGIDTDRLKVGYGTGGVASATGTFTGNDGQTVRVCGIQIGSGTNKSWDKAMGHPLADGQKSNESARNSGCGDTYQEHNGDAWYLSAFITNLAANENAVIPFSGAQWISQGNQVALDNTSAFRASGNDMGEIIISSTGTNIGKPYAGSAPSFTPSATFNANTTFGRDVYVVVPTAKVPAIGGDAVLKSLFRGSTSAICSAAAGTIKTAFGFTAPLTACGTTGNTALQQGYIP